MTRMSLRLLFLVCLAAWSLGCQAIEDFTVSRFKQTTPPVGNSTAFLSIWMNGVVNQADPARQGEMSPGFSGRFMLLEERTGNKSLSIFEEGTLVVELSDNGPPIDGTGHACREKWTIPSDVLKRYANEDVSGWGYNLWLPWTVRNDVTVVKLKSRFEKKNGQVLWSEPMLIKVRDNNGYYDPQISVRTQTMQGNPQMQGNTPMNGNAAMNGNNRRQ